MVAHKLSEKIFIIDALRTPIGGAFKSLSTFPAVQLASVVMTEILSRNQVRPDLIDEVILGNTVSAGVGQNLARQAAFLSSVPVTTPAYTLNSVCGSGLQSVISSVQAIFCGVDGLVVAGGAESVSQSPYLVRKNEKDKQGSDHFVDSLINDGLWCQLTNRHMGELAEFLAEKYHISRDEQDEYSLESHQKAIRAHEENKFTNEIVTIKVREGQYLSRDEKPRPNLDLERLKALPPAFKKGGTVTAGNSSAPADGAAAVILASEKTAKKHKLNPKARLLGYASVALEPELVFTAGVAAVKEVLKKCGLAFKDIDLFEISEAFAVQAIVTQRALKIPKEKMNIYGGDIALGHPLGAAGTRVLTTLLNALTREEKKRGLACVCLGGGGAVAVAIETIT